MKAILTALFLCFLLAACDGFIVTSIKGGPPYPVIFDQETFDVERAEWQKQGRQSYVFTLVFVGSSPKREPTRIVVEAGTISAYTALENNHETTITNIYSNLAAEVQKKRADYEAGKIAGARVVVNYTAEHYPSSIASYISSSEETGLIAGGYYQKYISDLDSVRKPDQGATPSEYPIEFDVAKFEEECAAWQTQDYVFEIEHRDYLAMSRKFKWVVENGAVTAVYDWDYNEWKPIPIPEVEDDHVFERLIGIYTKYRLPTVTAVYAYLEKELELMRERYKRGVIPGAEIDVSYASDGKHYPDVIEFFVPAIWSKGYYYRMRISEFKEGVTDEDKKLWNETYGDDSL